MRLVFVLGLATASCFPREARAQSFFMDSLVRIIEDPGLSVRERFDRSMEWVMITGPTQQIPLVDSLRYYIPNPTEDTRRFLDFIAFMEEKMDPGQTGVLMDSARILENLHYLESHGMYDVLASMWHGDTYLYEGRKMWPEFLYVLKASIRTYLDKVRDTASATHMVGHYFSKLDIPYSQAEVDTLFSFLNIVMGHLRRSTHTWGSSDSKEYLYTQLFFLYNDWGELDEARALAEELLEHGKVSDNPEPPGPDNPPGTVYKDGRQAALEWKDLIGFLYGSRGDWTGWDSIIGLNTEEYRRIVEGAEKDMLVPRMQMVPDGYRESTEVPADSLLGFLVNQYHSMIDFEYRVRSELQQEVYPWVLLLRIGNTLLEDRNRAHLLKGQFKPYLESLGFRSLDDLYRAVAKGTEASNYHLRALQTNVLYPDWIRYHRILGHDKQVIDLQYTLNRLLSQDGTSFKSRLMSSMQSFYEIQQRESQIALLNAKNEQARQRQLFLVIGSLLALLVIGGLVNRMIAMRRIQQKLDAAREKAMQSERAKQQFLANMSHEIRTPMNAIMGMTDILLRRNPKEEQLTYLGAIKESSQSLLVIINDILDLSKIEAGKIEFEHAPFSLDQVLSNIRTLMALKAEEKGLVLEVIRDEQVPSRLTGDSIRLFQVLVNLVGNAIKFTEKGNVSIHVEQAGMTADGRAMIRFQVADTGIGMDPDRLEKIFRSFEQAYTDTSRKYGGTGLGLTITRQLVEKQGGQIHVESQKGHGSRFTVEIPYDVPEPKDSEHADAPDEPKLDFGDMLKGIRILLAEDNEFNIMVASEALEDSIPGVQVRVARNGEEALALLNRESADLILMDLQMPVMNGFDATLAIRALSNDKAGIPIIAMTANVMKEEVEKCRSVGMNDHISKPFDTEELLAKMSVLVHRARKDNEQQENA